VYSSPHSDLEKVYKNNVLFNKFILLISKGDTYEELVTNRNEDVLREHCRNWNSVVSCSFDSTPVFTEIKEQASKINKILGEMDIRGKISEIDAKKKFHLIEDHINKVDPTPLDPKVPVPYRVNLFKLFFGLEVGCGRGCGANGASIAGGYYYSFDEEFKEFEDDEKMMDEDDTQLSQNTTILNSQQIIRGRWSHRRANP
jgi:hypothetical protein